MKHDNFVNIGFNSKNLDRFIVRTSILKALNSCLPLLQGRLLDAGCGKMPYRDYILRNGRVGEYVGLDIENSLEYDEKIRPDFTWDGKLMPFGDHSFDCCMATEVLEHCPEPELFLREVHRVLKPGGIVFFTVPFLWNLHEVPHDEYRYTPFSLSRHLTNSNLERIEIFPLGGWNASMGQMMGLWVRRAPMSGVARRVLSFVLKPIIKYLFKSDSKKPVVFREGTMITGLYGWAYKPTR